MSAWTWHRHGQTHFKRVCVAHRTVNKPCCALEKKILSYRWRPPKRTDDKAWRKIEAGVWNWENDTGKNDRVAPWERERRRNPKQGVSVIGELLDEIRYAKYRKGRRP